jgi:predicted ATPase/DNA-binding XRE family transcriptional regulator
MADSFGDLLRRFRVAASLTQEALAEQCRISPATIAAIEQGRRRAPRLSTVRLLAEALELSAADRELLARAADLGGGASGAVTAGRPGGAGTPGLAGTGDGSASSTGRPSTDLSGSDGTGLAASPVVGLPAARTTFIGRRVEQAAVLQALAENQVVSLVGPGGVGKTRLAARAAEGAAGWYPAGAVFVDLVPVREGFVSQAVAAVLGVSEGPGLSLDAALHEHLGRGPSLLVLDNCEHLLEVVAPFVEKLLANCGELTILATSRERLAIPGEQVVAVRPLSLSGDGRNTVPGAESGDPTWSEAEALFVDRARISDPGFSGRPEVVSQVCARLDGMPLAIELAAARSASLGVDGLLAGLDDHLRLLAGGRGAHERHRSLRAVIDWSHDLLDEDERAMFRRVGAFVGGFDIDAAVAVAGDQSRGTVADLVGRLTDKSLLKHRHGPEGSRWQMLETIRAYALDRLAESDEAAGVLDAHFSWAAAVARDLERRLDTEPAWQSAFDTVADDLRAALSRAPSPQAQAESHVLARALGHLTYAHRFMVESREHYGIAAARAAEHGEAASDLRTAADVAMAEGKGQVAFDLLLSSAERAGAAGDNAARSSALAYAVTIADRFAAEFPAEVPHDRLRQMLDEATEICPPGDRVAGAYVAAAAAWVGQAEKTVPDLALASAALAAARPTGDPVLISGALDAVVGALDAGGRLREAHQVNRERARLLEHLPRHHPRAGAEIIDTYHMVAEIAVTAGDLPDALGTAQMAQGDSVLGEQPHRTASKPILPLVLQGRFDEAFDRATSMWEAWQKAGRPVARWMAPAVYGVVLGYGLRGDDEKCREWLFRLSELTGTGFVPAAGSNLVWAEVFTNARIALHRGRMEAALSAVSHLNGTRQPWYEAPHWYSLRPYAWAVTAEVAVVAGLPDSADRLAEAAPAAAENYWAAACLARAAGRLNNDRVSLEQSVAGWERIGARFERACTLLLLPGRADEGRAELAVLGCQPPAEPGPG